MDTPKVSGGQMAGGQDGPEPTVNVRRWATAFTPDQPHGLQDLEDQLRAQAPASTRIRPATLLGTLGLIAGLTVFINASDGIIDRSGRTLIFDFGPVFEISAMVIGFALVLLFQADVIRMWARNGRVRDSSTVIASSIVALGSAAAITLSASRIGPSDWRPTAFAVLIPPALACIGGIVLALRGRRPHPWRSGWRSRPLVNLAALHPSEQEPLLRLRGKALRTLHHRGLLCVDEEELRTLECRPLGRLAG